MRWDQVNLVSNFVLVYFFLIGRIFSAFRMPPFKSGLTQRGVKTIIDFGMNTILVVAA